MKVYVGPYHLKPESTPRAYFLDHALPHEMSELIRDFFLLSHWKGSIWINNPYALDGLNPNDIYVLTPTGEKQLSSHPEWERWKDMIRPGEFWAFVGNDW